MSTDKGVVEMRPNGDCVNLTAALSIAWASMRRRPLGAVSHVCAVCKKLPIGAPTVILMDVQDGSHTWWCRRCYSDKIKDDPEDNRAGRKKDGELDDVGLPKNQWQRDKADNENRPCLTLKGQQRTALNRMCMKVYRRCNAELEEKMANN
jgi:hypothetical protein